MKVFVMLLSRIVLLASLSLTAPAVMAHEFWIEPLQYQIDNGGTLEAEFKNGQEFKGNTLSFFDRNSQLFEMSANAERITLTPRLGDNPALNITAPARDTLVTIVHETTPALVTYSEWAKFLKFAEHKDFKQAAKDHLAAGWSDVKFKESYTRHAKALIGVGTGDGADEKLGLETEFVALSNPYEPTFDNKMKVSLYFKGARRQDAQVEVFDRAHDDTVTVTLHRTDANGEAIIPVTPGHTYLFDAVVLRPFDGATSDEGATVWQTYWAALTFQVPQ
jgi:cobalt/nickel transport protein